MMICLGIIIINPLQIEPVDPWFHFGNKERCSLQPPSTQRQWVKVEALRPQGAVWIKSVANKALSDMMIRKHLLILGRWRGLIKRACTTIGRS